MVQKVSLQDNSGVTRRSLRASEQRSSRRLWRTGAAIAVTALLAAGGYGFAATSGDGGSPAALSTQAPEPPRQGAVSRSVDRFPIDDATLRTIEVTVDGQVHELQTRAETLAAALAEADIDVGFLDEVSAPMGGEPVDATVVRVSETIETVTEEVPYKTVRTKTDSLYKGTEKVQTRGKAGERTTTKKITRKGEEVLAEEILAEAVSSESVDEVILVGTKDRPAPVRAAPSSTSGSAPATLSGGSPRAVAQGMLSSFGWGQDQWSCLDRLWQRESNWNPSAMNRSSGAYGIPQALPGSKMASAGADWRTNPATQIKWGMGYIKGRYGSPCGAWGHSQAKGWY